MRHMRAVFNHASEQLTPLGAGDGHEKQITSV